MTAMVVVLYAAGWVLLAAACRLGRGGQRRTFWRLMFWSLATWCLAAALVGVTPLAAVFAVFAGVSRTLWVHSRDDDDDRWRRLLAWAKSHLPRPVTVHTRPAEATP